jgi:hypothetical protein
LQDGDGLGRLGTIPIVHVDIGAPDEALPIDHKVRRQRQGPRAVSVMGQEVDAELEVQRPQRGRETVHQPVLPGDAGARSMTTANVCAINPV